MNFNDSFVTNSNVDISMLENLKRIFDLNIENKNSGLDLDEFIGAFTEVLGDESDRETLTSLYMKIDANSDGKVTWKEFLEYMLLQNIGLNLVEDFENKTTFKKVCKSTS